MRVISDTTWDNFFTSENTAGTAGSLIAYVPTKRQLIVVSSYGATSSSGNAYIYDFVTQSWVFADDLFGTDTTEISNIVNDWDGDLVYLENASSNVKLQKVSVTPKISTAFELISKEIDFGNPASKKNIYKIIATYTGGTSQNITTTYGVDGGTLDGTLSGAMTAGNAQTILELTPSSIISNAKSFQLKLAGTSASTFELNDIGIVYREKRVV